MDFDEYVHLAQVAERGKFDMCSQDSAAVAPAFYLAGGKAPRPCLRPRVACRLEPLTLLAALATVTEASRSGRHRDHHL